MPAKTPDKGVNRFEVRTGLTTPVLGGMYRAGDPAVAPPNKQHLIVNMRITPAGMISRPGLVEEFDTTVAECIDGITGDPTATPQTLLIHGVGQAFREQTLFLSGATAQPWSFRAISRKWDPGPPSGAELNGYSELIYVLHGAPDTADGADQPVLKLDQTDDPLDTWGESFPFVLNGKILQFIHSDRLRTDGSTERALGLVELLLPETGPDQRVTGCLGTSEFDPGNWDPAGLPPGTACPDRIPGDVWPWGMPLGQARLLCWVPNLLAATWTGTPDDWNITQIVSIPERLNNPLTGEVGVRETLYVILEEKNADPHHQTLLRYDGISWSIELVLPDYTTATGYMRLGSQAYGPFVTTTRVVWNGGGVATTAPWGRERLADGSYGVLTWGWQDPYAGANPVNVPGTNYRSLSGYLSIATNFQGFPAAVMIVGDQNVVFAVAKNGNWTPDADWRPIVNNLAYVHAPQVAVRPYCIWLGQKLFVLITTGTGPPALPYFNNPGGRLWVYDFSVVPAATGGTPYGRDADAGTPGIAPQWVQLVGSRVYLAGTDSSAVPASAGRVWDFTIPGSPVLIWLFDPTAGGGAADMNEKDHESGIGRWCLPMGWVSQADAGEGTGTI